MNKKHILAVVAGLVGSVIIIMIAEWVTHQIYPLPAGVSPDNMESLRAYIPQAPFGALFLIIIGWGCGAVVAGWVATRVSKQSTSRPALTAGGILTVLCIINCAMLPTPLWFWVLGVGVSVPSAWFGFRLVKA